MSSLLYLLLAVVLSVLGSLILWARYRQPKSMYSGIDQFARELRALAPDETSGREGRRWGERRSG